MKNKKISFLSMLLAVVLVLTSAPITAIASVSSQSELNDEISSSNDSPSEEPTGVEIVSEDISKREESQKHFLLSNGTYLAVQYNQPVHMLNQSNEWVSINSSFVYEEATDQSSDFDGYVKAFDKTTTKISTTTNGTVLKTYGADDNLPVSLKILSEGATSATAQVIEPSSGLSSDDETAEEKNERIIREALIGPKVQFLDALENVDFVYKPTPSGVEEEIVINDRGISEISFELDVGNLIATLDSFGNIRIKDDTETDKYVIYAPFVCDATDSFHNSIEYTLNNTENGKYVLSVVIDDEWINSETTTLPIAVNSSVFNASDTSSYIEDVYVSSQNVSYDESTEIRVGKSGESIDRAYYKFNYLPTLKDTDIFISAKLHLSQKYVPNYNDNNSLELRAFSLNESWDTSSLMWNAQPEHSDRYLCSKEIALSEMSELTYNLNISEEIRKHYENNESYGIVISTSNETADGHVSFFSSEATSILHPYILVNYIDLEAITNVETDSDAEMEQLNTSVYNEIDSTIITSDTFESTSTAVESDTTTEREFQEITDSITMTYYVGNDTAHALINGGTVSQIDGVRLTTSDSEYYLKYRSRNIEKNWLEPVYSYKSGIYDYAGWYGYAMTNLSIEVYLSTGTRLFDDYVVMYRAKVDEEWLAWVSNGQPEVMQTIKDEFELDGELDINCTDVGWYTKGIIQGLEIRMFKRINAGSSGSSGTREFQTVSGIGMQYYVTGSTEGVDFSSNNVAESSTMYGISLHTNALPFYFKYRSRRSDNVWLSFVDSRNTGVYDFAGLSGYGINNFEIQVYLLDGTRIFDNYVVMYRAKVAGDWLAWVSNGQPEVMQAIKTQFGLEGDLDTVATDAGDSRYGQIEALEIHVYECEDLIVTPTEESTYISNVPYINQNVAGLLNGCEIISTVMALQYQQINIDPLTFITNYLDIGPSPRVGGIGPDPAEVFVGDPRSTSGWGCYVPVIKKALDKFIAEHNCSATVLNGKTLEYLCTEYIDNDIPVIFWATVGMTSDYKDRCWTTVEGKSIVYNNKLHCLLLVGYDDDYYYFNDPLQSSKNGYSCVGYAKSDVELAYGLLNSQAIVIQKIDPGENEDDEEKEEVVEDKTIDEKKENDVYPQVGNNFVADPIDLSSGSHVISHSLMTIYGAQTISFDIDYSSNLLLSGSLGTGWSNKFEKKIVELDNMILLYDNPTYYSIYTRTSDSSSTYTTTTLTKENYSLTKSDNGYVVNCNNKYTEYYNTAGLLCKITTKSGFNTLIEYPDTSTIKITDELSGRYMVVSKNTEGKIVSVTDNTDRSCVLGYTDDCLTSITDENGNTISYLYNENKQIERGMDELGTVYFTNTYDAAGRIVSQEDDLSSGAVTVINYDEASLPGYTLVTVYDRLYQKTLYKYNSSNQLVSKTDPNGIEISYEYDAAGNVTKTTDGAGNSIINEYDSRNNLISSTDKLGRKTEYTYDNNNNLTKITYPNGSIVTNTYDDKNRLTSSTDLRGVVTTYEYNTLNQLVKVSYLGKSTEYVYLSGQVSSVTDRLGRTTTNEYNSAGLLISSTDALNNTTRYTYDSKGNVLTVTDAQSNITTDEYDANGNLIKRTDAKGYSTLYTYNGNLKMTSMTLPIGVTIFYEYDDEDRLVCVTYPDGKTERTEYDLSGRVSKQIDKDGNVTVYEYDAANNVTKITNAEGGITVNEYNAAGNIVKTTDPLGNSTTYEYDNMGNLIKSTNAMGGITEYTYNTSGDILTVKDPIGNVTTNTYDALGRLHTVTDPRGYTTEYSYDDVGNLVTVENALDQITTNTYDSLNRLVSVKDPGNHTTTYSYDELGRMISSTDARGYTTRQYYDALGNIIKTTDESDNIDFEAVYDAGGRAINVTDAAGSVTINEYDYSGNLTKQTDALNKVRTYSYNGNGMMISAVDQAGGISYATYDGMGNLTSITGPGGSNKEFVYNSVGLMTSESTVTAWDNTYTYNALGLVTVKVGASNAETTYTYDAAGRLTSTTDSMGAEIYTVSYTYDANGNVLTVTDNTGTVTREYDALNRVTKYTDTLGNVIQYEYDRCGNLSKMTYPNGEIGVYTYDTNHNMISTSLEDCEYITSYEYNAQNQITKIYRPDGSVCTKTYNTAGQLTNSTDLDADGDFVVADVYTYDALGRLVEEINLGSYSRYTMTYDNLGRLVQRVERDIRSPSTVQDTEVFTYDAAGNILTDSDGNTFEYTENNVIESANGATYHTDSRGNANWCLSEGFVPAAFDLKNRIKNTNSGEHVYTYDGENNRVSMTSETTSMQYTHDTSDGRNRLIWTKDQDNDVTIYGYGAEGIVWSLCNGEYMFYHYDYRGSVMAVTDIDGIVTDTVKYDVYGAVAARTGDSELILGYNGEYGVLTDLSGLLYMRTRYYSTELKRFLSADVINGSISDSTTLNLYSYVSGNPISFIDPFGMSAERGQNNENVINDIHWLFNCSYDYFSSYTDEAERIKVTNDAVMKYLICDRYYSSSFLKGIAWDIIGGELDTDYLTYMSQHDEFLPVRESIFYDLDSGEEIDFLHMIATLCAYNHESTSGALFTIPSAYAGWAGDLITLAGDVNKNITTTDCDIVELTKDLMRGNDSSFPISDLIGDIDAVLINEYMSTMPIDEAFEAYYSYDYKDRYEMFFAKEFGGYINNVYSSAESYLSPGPYNFTFRKAFHSEYSNDIIPYVAQGFTEYFVYEVGR